MQQFIETQGKPCCLNLITDKDNKFIQNTEIQAKKESAGE
jgi:hypothetical protein